MVIAAGFSIVDEQGKRLIAPSGQANGFYETAGRAQAFLTTRMNQYDKYAKVNDKWAKVHQESLEFYSKYKVVPVQIVVKEE